MFNKYFHVNERCMMSWSAELWDSSKYQNLILCSQAQVKSFVFVCAERTGNCTVAAIPPWMGDAAKLEGRPVRLKLASELLQVGTI